MTHWCPTYDYTADPPCSHLAQTQPAAQAHRMTSAERIIADARAGTLLPSARPLPDLATTLPCTQGAPCRCGCQDICPGMTVHCATCRPSLDVTEPDPTPTGRTRTYTVADLQLAEPARWPTDKPAAGRNFDPYARHDTMPRERHPRTDAHLLTCEPCNMYDDDCTDETGYRLPAHPHLPT